MNWLSKTSEVFGKIVNSILDPPEAVSQAAIKFGQDVFQCVSNSVLTFGKDVLEALRGIFQ